MIRKAFISEDKLYRYLLYRRWSRGGELLWVMLNPSTADAEEDDATTRRCIALSSGWGFGAAVIVNLFGYISTDPKKLNSINDPVGPDNNSVLLDRLKKNNDCMVAWGSRPEIDLFQSRVKEISKHLPNTVMCLGLTKQNYPRHPLRVSSSTKPVRYAK